MNFFWLICLSLALCLRPICIGDTLSLNNWLIEAELLHQRGQFKECAQLIDLHFHQSTLNQNELCEVLILKASALQKLGFFQEAYQNLRRISKKIDYLEGEQQVTLSIQISDLFLAVGRADEAAAYAEKAYSIANELKDPGHLATSLNNLGNTHMVAGGFTPSMAENSQLDKEIHSLVSEKNLMVAKRGTRAIGIKQSDSERRQIQAAIEYYSKGAQAALAGGQQSLAARASINKARAAMILKNYDLAIQEIQVSSRLLKDIPVNFEKGFLYLSLGILTNELNDSIPVYRNLDLRLMTWETLKEVEQIGNALENGYLLSYAKALMAQLYQDKGRIEEAIHLTRRAIFFAQQEQSSEILYRWQWQLGRLLNQVGESEIAIVHYKKAITTLNRIRNALAVGYRSSPDVFKKSIKPMYYELAELYIIQAEQSTDRVEEQEFLQQARQIVEVMKSAELEDLFQDPCVIAYKAKEITLDAIQSDSAVLYPIPFENRLALLVTFPDGLHLFSSSVEFKDLDQIVRRYRAHLQDETSMDFRGEAKKLYDWIIQPLESELEKAKISTLIVVPDGVLTLMPFSTLHDGKQYVIENYAVVTTPGLTVVNPRALPRVNLNAILFGLSQPSQEYAPLPGVEKELDDIQKIIDATVIKNEAFTKDRVVSELKDTNYRLMHIATHGNFDRESENTFLLTFNEKLNLASLEELIKFSKFRDEPLELLTLSACQTAVGDERAALGLAGVAVKSGARSAVASLWYIDDEATTELITEFYRQYFNDVSLNKAQAMQNAQKKLIASSTFNHPAQWAPFLVIGNWL